MIFLSRKNGNVGEIRVIVTESDRAENFITGSRPINLNDCINTFNKDPDVTQLYLIANYAGDLKDEALDKYMHALINSSKTITKNDESKQKVDSSGKTSEDEEESEEEIDLKEILSQYDFTCKKCNDSNKALMDHEGNLHECESCIKIDAYLKGKKEGYDKGFDEGYAKCMKDIQKICSNDIQVSDFKNKSQNDKKDDL